MSKRLTNKDFLEKSIKVHGKKYDYSNVDYVDIKTKVCILCPEHGEFWQTPDKHLLGQGCPKCAEILRIKNRHHITAENFISDAKEIHGNLYDYSLVSECENNHTKVKIICKKHGVFEQDYVHHVKRKQGCPYCAGNTKSNSESFEKKASLVHNGKYSYDNVLYNGTHKKVIITCPIHGKFEQTPHDHLEGKGCPMCSNKISKSEDEIYDFLVKHFGREDVEKRNRDLLDGKEVDIFVKSKKIGIEYNGIRWHSEKFKKDKYYHLNKTKKFNENGCKLIQIFEDEFIEKYKIVFSKIKQLFGLNFSNKKISARKCSVKEITYNVSKSFLDTNHIQGHCKSSIHLGCFYKDVLIGVMSFTDLGNGKWDLNRFATDNELICRGVGGKLFSFFVKKYSPKEVISFADIRWTLSSSNNLYTNLGFRLTSILPPDYKYTKGFKRFHKFNFRKQRLHKKYGLPLEMTETEMAAELGYYRIWDCGLFKYVWKNSENDVKTETIIVD